MSAVWWLPDLDATQALGAAIGAAATPGLVIAAVGPLGAGKTSLAQGVGRGLGVPAGHHINSPTFNILQIHPGRLPFAHLDLYRLDDPDDAIAIDLDEVFTGDAVSLIEWPDRLPGLLPGDHLRASLRRDGDGRTVTLSASGPQSAGVLERVRAAVPTGP